MYKIIHTKVLRQAKQLPGLLGNEVENILQNIIRIDENSKGGISLLSRRIALALSKENKIPDELLIELGCAQIFGWAAYTAYDAILDRQMPNVILPAANTCNHFFTEYYNQDAFKNFKSCFCRIVQGMEAANYWEQANARNPQKLPDYGECQILADRGMGHALGALVVMNLAGYAENSSEFKMLEAFFRNYIIAKQLHDDACDWREDLMERRISPIVATMLAAGAESGKLDEFFEKHSRHLAAQQILNVLAKAENCLVKLASVLEVNFLLPLLKPLKSGAIANS